MNCLLRRKFSFADFTLFAIFACILGVNFSIKAGGIQLSLYRLILVIAPFVFLLPAYNKLRRNKNNSGLLFIFFLGIWLTYSIFTGLWVLDYLAWIKYLFFLASGFLFSILIFANINSKELFIKSIRIVVIVSALLAPLAFYESITGNYFFLDESSLEWYQDVSLLHKVSIFREPITFFGNPNNYALFLFYSFGFTSLLLFIETNKFLKVLYAIFLAVTVFLVIITFSRSALIGIGFFITSMLFVSLFKGSRALRNRVLFLLLLVGIVAIQLLIKYSQFTEGILLLEFGTEGTSDSIRTNLILNGFIILYNTFFMGTGLGNIEPHMAIQNAYDVGDIVNSHNWWMEILVSSGVLIFGLYVWIYLKTFYRLWRQIRIYKKKSMFWIKSVSAGLFLGFIIASVGPSSLIECEWLWPLMALSFKSAYILEN